MRIAACTLAAVVAAFALAAAAAGQERAKSGTEFMTPATRALQDDDFQNPGMFAVDRGRELWSKAEGRDGRSCASCHGGDGTSLRGVAATYPRFDAARGGLVNLEMRINAERTGRMGAPAFAYESEDLLALTAFVAFQSRGLPMSPEIGGPAAPFFEAGQQFFMQRRGQLDLACANCHEALVGARLRGDTISQGQINGFPIYRLQWRTMASRHRLFEWCNTSVRAEPYALGSEEYLSLELYLAWRGRGLPIEAPGVRR